MAPRQRGLLHLLAFLFALPLFVLGQEAAAVAYTPSSSACPRGTKLVRLAGTTRQELNTEESAYISTRETKVLPNAWATYLANVKASAKSTRTSVPNYVSEILGSHNPALFPRLAITASGGGYRAAIFSAGVFSTLDGRNATSVHAGTGGLLQTASYIGGLSGGSWLLSSLLQANYPTLPELIFADDAVGKSGNINFGWNAGFDLLQPGNASVVEEFLGLTLEEVAGKAEAGFPITLTDIWGRSLARHFENGTTMANILDDSNLTHGAGITFSGLVNL